MVRYYFDVNIIDKAFKVARNVDVISILVDHGVTVHLFDSNGNAFEFT